MSYTVWISSVKLLRKSTSEIMNPLLFVAHADHYKLNSRKISQFMSVTHDVASKFTVEVYTAFWFVDWIVVRVV